MANIEDRAERTSSYFRLFHGGKVLMSEIETESPYVAQIVHEMVNTGELVGQYTFTFTPNPEPKMDIMVWVSEKNGTDID